MTSDDKLESESAVAALKRGQTSTGEPQVLNRILKRFGGRHLIFRTQIGSWKLFRKSYALVSTFRGPIWFFYGIGQVWVTHRKYREFDGWMARVPRRSAPKIVELLDRLEAPLTEFTHYCNEHGIEGTLIIEANVIEFHWTFDYSVEKESMKQEHTKILDQPFQALVDRFLESKTELGMPH
ncbi:MAG: hypothetical protein ACI87E_003301 [Mariniblastus sp.]|jgi:hypothetical protein